jgi:hypothetical protein
LNYPESQVDPGLYFFGRFRDMVFPELLHRPQFDRRSDQFPGGKRAVQKAIIGLAIQVHTSARILIYLVI